MKNFKLLGFIKTEALIIIVIVCLGLATASLAYFSAKSSARDQQRLIDIGSMQKALQIYFTESGGYPDGTKVAMPAGMENYLDRWPTAPPADGSCTRTQNSYLYSQKSNGADYILTFCLGAGTNGLPAGSHLINSKGIQ